MMKTINLQVDERIYPQVIGFLRLLPEKVCHIMEEDDSMLKAGKDAGPDGFQRFLIDSPEMSDEEYRAIEEKRRHLNQWI